MYLLMLDAAADSSSAANLNCSLTAAATSGWFGSTDWARGRRSFFSDFLNTSVGYGIGFTHISGSFKYKSN